MRKNTDLRIGGHTSFEITQKYGYFIIWDYSIDGIHLSSLHFI